VVKEDSAEKVSFHKLSVQNTPTKSFRLSGMFKDKEVCPINALIGLSFKIPPKVHLHLSTERKKNRKHLAKRCGLVYQRHNVV